MKQDLLLPFLVIGIIMPILFSPVIIQGNEPSYNEVEVDFQYPKNPTELKSQKLIQLPTNQDTFTKYIITLSEAIEVKEEYSTDPPDIESDIKEVIKFEDELSFVLMEGKPNE